jgi:hypothetical protein
MNNIYQIKTPDSRREFKIGIQNLIVAYSVEVYKLKRKMRKRDLFINAVAYILRADLFFRLKN